MPQGRKLDQAEGLGADMAESECCRPEHVNPDQVSPSPCQGEQDLQEKREFQLPKESPGNTGLRSSEASLPEKRGRFWLAALTCRWGMRPHCGVGVMGWG